MNFHYKINKYVGKADGKCEEEIISIWPFSHRCRDRSKENIDGAMLCKIHANSLRKWRMDGNKRQ